MTYQEILEAALRQCAADCSCAPEDFLRDTDVVVESKPNENGSRYMDLPHICAMFTWGSNVVVSCRKDLIPDMEAYAAGNTKLYRCFDVPGLYTLNRILEKAGAERKVTGGKTVTAQEYEQRDYSGTDKEMLDLFIRMNGGEPDA